MSGIRLIGIFKVMLNGMTVMFDEKTANTNAFKFVLKKRYNSTGGIKLEFRHSYERGSEGALNYLKEIQSHMALGTFFVDQGSSDRVATDSANWVVIQFCVADKDEYPDEHRVIEFGSLFGKRGENVKKSEGGKCIYLGECTFTSLSGERWESQYVKIHFNSPLICDQRTLTVE